MTTTQQDVLELFDFAWARFGDRMVGLTDTEWAWQPTADPDLSLRWRLAHLAETLGEDRNAQWLGLAPPEPVAMPAAADADTAVSNIATAYRQWRGQLAAMSDQALAAPLGAVAAPYGDSSRLSFALHIADEFVHHTAEAALLRDLYAGTSPAQ